MKFLAFNDQIAIVAEITEITEEAVYLKEIKKENQKELPSSITIASGYPKGEKLDWIVQKSTELGAQAFLGFRHQPLSLNGMQKRMKRQQRRKDCSRGSGTIPSADRAISRVIGNETRFI